MPSVMNRLKRMVRGSVRTVRKPVRKVSKALKKSVRRPVRKAPKKSARKVAKKSVRKVAKKSARKVAKKSARKVAKKSATKKKTSRRLRSSSTKHRGGDFIPCGPSSTWAKDQPNIEWNNTETRYRINGGRWEIPPDCGY